MRGVLLYIQNPVTVADLVAAGHEFAAAHHAEVQDLSPEYRQINLVPEEIPDAPIFCELVRRGDPGDLTLITAAEDGVPFHPEVLLSVDVSWDRDQESVVLRFASEVVAFFVQRWTSLLYSDVYDRLYTPDEVLANSRDGKFPY